MSDNNELEKEACRVATEWCEKDNQPASYQHTYFGFIEGARYAENKLQQENDELKVYKEKWQEISGKANAIYCLKEAERLENENTLLKQAVEKLEKCREFYGNQVNWHVNIDDNDFTVIKYLDQEWGIEELPGCYTGGKLARQIGKEVEEIMKKINKNEKL